MSEVQAFKMERDFRAPIDLVWQAWTDPVLMDQWFGPKGCETQILDFTLAPGGTSFYQMRFGDAPPMYGKYFYETIEKPNYLSWRHGFADADGNLIRHPANPDWPEILRCEVWFAAASDIETRMVFLWTPVDANEAERASFEAGRAGALGGWTNSFDQLDDLLDTIKQEGTWR